MKNRWIIGGVITLGCLSAYFMLRNDKPKDNEIKIAINLPLSGPVASFSGGFPNGLKMGVSAGCSKYNVSEKSFVFMVDDNKASPSDSSTIFRRHGVNGYDAYVVGTTESAEAVLPNLGINNDIPVFLVAFDAFMAKKGENRFRLLPNFKTEVNTWLEFLDKTKPDRVATLTLNIPATQEQFNTFIFPYLSKHKVETMRETFDFSTTTFREIAMRIKKFHPDVVLISGYAFQLQMAVTALRELDCLRENRVMTSIDLADFVDAGESLERFEGVVFSCPNVSFPIVEPEVEKWRGRFEKLYGKKPGYMEAFAYDTGLLLVKTYSNKGRVTPKDIIATTPMKGITGNVLFDVGRDSISALSLARIKNGTVIKFEE